MTVAFVYPSPNAKKKWRVDLANGKHVDFGHADASDFTIHKDSHRMLAYLLRHGGVSRTEYNRAKQLSHSQIISRYLNRSKSTKENWKDITTPGFWARWLLWSKPSLRAGASQVKAISGISVRFV